MPRIIRLTLMFLWSICLTVAAGASLAQTLEKEEDMVLTNIPARRAR